jgi:hypothetical protein
MPAAKAITTTQTGKIGEAIVSAQLILASGGRLCPYVAFADDDGVDLLVLDKVTRRVLMIQVKGRTGADGPKGATVQFDVRLKTFREHPGALLLAVLFDDKGWGGLERLWLVPSAELRSVAHATDDKISIRPSPKPGSRDRYAPFRLNDMREVVTRMIASLEAEPGVATLPSPRASS